MPDLDNPDMDPATLDAWLRVHASKQKAPFMFSSNMLKQAAARGLDVKRLKADGVLAETKRIPT